MSLSDFKIEANVVGEGTKVWVDDEPQEGVMGLELHIGPREVTQLVLYREATGTVEGRGMVTTVTPEELPHQIIKWLESLNFKTVVQKAMERTGWGEDAMEDQIRAVLIEEVQHASGSK